jgi:hypothetical protein
MLEEHLEINEQKQNVRRQAKLNFQEYLVYFCGSHTKGPGIHLLEHSCFKAEAVFYLFLHSLSLLLGI